MNLYENFIEAIRNCPDLRYLMHSNSLTKVFAHLEKSARSLQQLKGKR
jgi:hypothetical protein